jgi:uncharacterized iron-regulated membrane protein
MHLHPVSGASASGMRIHLLHPHAYHLCTRVTNARKALPASFLAFLYLLSVSLSLALLYSLPLSRSRVTLLSSSLSPPPSRVPLVCVLALVGVLAPVALLALVAVQTFQSLVQNKFEDEA